MEKEKKQKITLSLSPKNVRDIKHQAINEGRSASDIINELITKYLQDKKAL